MIPWFLDLFKEVRWGARGLLRQPGFALVVLITLALTIGVNTTMFSFIDRIQFRPVIRDHPEELVSLYNKGRDPGHGFRAFTYAEFCALRDSNPVFSDITAFSSRLCGVGREGALRRSFVYYSAGNYFSLMGVQPFRGRFFTNEECRREVQEPLVVASYALWRRLGASEDFVGSTIRIDDVTCTVVGIAPRGFGGTTAVLGPEAWMPAGMASGADGSMPPSEREPAWMLLGRLHPGAGLRSAQAQAAPLNTRLDSGVGEAGRDLFLARPSRTGIGDRPLDDSAGPVMGFAALGMAVSVLLVASLNLANLVLARGLARRREFAIRLALGASRSRVIRQILIESLLLAMLGGLAGFWLSHLFGNMILQRLVSQFQSTTFSVSLDLAPDFRVGVATFIYALVTVLLFGLVPAFRSTRFNLVKDLKEIGSGNGEREGFFSLRHTLVMGQVALSLVLLFCTGLFLRCIRQLERQDVGFAVENRLIAEVDYGLMRLPPSAVKGKQLELLERVRAMPGVERAALATQTPYAFFVFHRGVRLPGEPPQASQGTIHTQISASYFETMGLPLLQGRSFSDSECQGIARVAVIDEGLATRLFGTENPLGRRVVVDGDPASDAGLEVIGVVRGSRQLPMGEARPRHLYRPLEPEAHVYLHIQLKQGVPQAPFLVTLRRELHGLDTAYPLLQALPMRAFMDANISLSSLRMASSLFGSLALLALVLALIGVYGLKAYLVATRTREVGIRMALGARPGQVLQLFLVQGALQILVALSVGALLALGASRAFQGFLGPVSPADPWVLAGSALLLGGSVMMACAWPAWRAARVDPKAALGTPS